MSTKWNATMQFPTDSEYVNRITKATFGPSKSSGNPMITLECEVVKPEEVEIGTEKVTIAGVSTSNYYTTQTDDEEKTANSRDRVTKLLSNLGIDVSNLDWDNLGPQIKPLEGKLILTMMSAKVQERRKTPTIAQIEAAKKQGLTDFRNLGDIMKNPVTGKPLVNYWPQIDEIFGLAPDQTVGQPY